MGQKVMLYISQHRLLPTTHKRNMFKEKVSYGYILTKKFHTEQFIRDFKKEKLYLAIDR